MRNVLFGSKPTFFHRKINIFDETWYFEMCGLGLVLAWSWRGLGAPVGSKRTFFQWKTISFDEQPICSINTWHGIHALAQGFSGKVPINDVRSWRDLEAVCARNLHVSNAKPTCLMKNRCVRFTHDMESMLSHKNSLEKCPSPTSGLGVVLGWSWRRFGVVPGTVPGTVPTCSKMI